jgi:hypothetical protein
VRSRLVVAVALAAAGAAPVHAQESPAQVAAAFFKAVAEERWRDAARQLDLAAFDRFRRERIAAARLPQPPHRQTTVEDLLRHDPDMPRAVAEYQIRKMTEAQRQVFNWVDHEFAGVADVDSLAALSAEESAARWLQARDLRWQSRRAAERERARGCALPPEADSAMPSPVHEVVATAVTDSATAYVLYRDAIRRRAEPDLDAAVHSDGPSVMTLRRRGGRWQILPREGMLHGLVGVVHVVSPDCRPLQRAPR